MSEFREEEGRVQKRAGQSAGVLISGKADMPVRLLPSVVYELCLLAEGLLPAGPDERRIRLRDLRFRMSRCYRHLPRLNESELAQALAEEDGEDVEPPDTLKDFP